MPQILDGNRVRDDIKRELKPRIEALAARGRTPGLAVVLVGHNPASEIYVRNKIKTCHDLGICSESITPPGTISTGELLEIVASLHARRHHRAIEARRHSDCGAACRGGRAQRYRGQAHGHDAAA